MRSYLERAQAVIWLARISHLVAFIYATDCQYPRLSLLIDSAKAGVWLRCNGIQCFYVPAG
jgi:hypothetical protein